MGEGKYIFQIMSFAALFEINWEGKKAGIRETVKYTSSFLHYPALCIASCAICICQKLLF